MSDEEAKEWIDTLDENHDGKVSFSGMLPLEPLTSIGVRLIVLTLMDRIHQSVWRTKEQTVISDSVPIIDLYRSGID